MDDDDGSPRRGEALPRVGKRVSEAEFQKLVLEVARDYGWTTHHVQHTQTGRGRWITAGTRGFPDLTLLRPPQLVFLELKKRDGVATPEQKRWIADLQRVPGVEAFIVSPDDLAAVFALLVQPAP